MNEGKLHSISEVCAIIKDKGFGDFHTHNLRYLEKVLVDVFEVRRDEYLNRVYTNKDIETLETVLRLKDQGLNYGAIKTVLLQSEVACKDIKVDNFDEQTASEETASNLELANRDLASFTDLMSAIVDKSVKESLMPELQAMKDSLDELKAQNENLKYSLELKEDEHFRQLDEKLSKWREESFYKKKSWIKRLMKK